jgi:CheY-like chemotaxis protein
LKNKGKYTVTTGSTGGNFDTMEKTMDKKPLILIVDDTLKNIQVLGAILLEQGYNIHVARSGKQAIQAASEEKPDMILLDVIMPEMDGFETCRRLKANDIIKNIPVIFLTAKTAEEDMLKGFEVGGVDYVTKPFSPVVLLARVNTHINLKFAYEKLEKQKIALEESAILRENVDRIIRHDLKSPINGIITLSDLLAEESDLTPDYQKKVLRNIRASGYQMLDMINSSLDIYKMETGVYQYKPSPVNILQVFKKMMVEMRNIADAKNVTIEIMRPDQTVSESDTFIVQGEPLLCYSLFANLLKNALEASPENGHVTIFLEDSPTVTIHNQGAVPKTIRDNFFDKYTTVGKSKGTGLGTYSAKLMAETQGGTVHFETSEEMGTRVTVRLLKLEEGLNPSTCSMFY